MLQEFMGAIHIFGAGGGGKTTLLHRIKTNQFLSDTKLTVGIDYKILNIDSSVNGTPINLTLQVYDRGGQEQWRFLDSSYDKLADSLTFAGVVVVDMTKPLGWQEDSFSMARKFKGNTNQNKKMIVVGTKLDQLNDEDISTYRTDLESIASQEKYFGPVLTSAKTGEGIPELKDEVIRAFVDYFPNLFTK